MVAFLTVMGIVLLNLLIAFLTGAHSEVRSQAKAKVGLLSLPPPPPSAACSW